LQVFLLQKLKGSTSDEARDSNTIKTRPFIVHFSPPLQGKAPKEIHIILTETLGENAPLYATVKNWVAQFKRGNFSNSYEPRPGRP
jgi:ABC-type dipeptide/oligopeptide/nickel transport system permease component